MSLRDVSIRMGLNTSGFTGELTIRDGKAYVEGIIAEQVFHAGMAQA